MPEQVAAFVPFKVAIDADRAVTARFYRTLDGAAPATLVLGHGAGAGQRSPFMVAFARGLSDRGIAVVTFDFPYMEARKKVPDRNAVLEASWLAVVEAVLQRPEHRGHLVVGGKSMGGRIGSQVAAEPAVGARVDGLVFLGYPLHPPGRPDQRRDAHLPRVGKPMLFVQGERDTFGNASEMRTLIASLAGAELYLVPGGNHSLVPSGRAGDRDRVYASIQDQIATWIRRVIA